MTTKKRKSKKRPQERVAPRLPEPAQDSNQSPPPAEVKDA